MESHTPENCDARFSYVMPRATRAFSSPELVPSITRDNAETDIDYLIRRLEVQASYLTLRKFDYLNALDCLKSSLAEPVNTLIFARSLQKIVMQLGDAHARIQVDLRAEDDRYLPFIIADSDTGIVALKKGKKGLLHERFPYIEAIDGIALAEWIETATRFVPAASPQAIRRGALRELRSIDKLRAERGMQRLPDVNIVLRSRNGQNVSTLQMPTRKKPLPGGKLSFDNSKRLPNNIGYLRISSMKDSKINEVIELMTAFSDTDGLIIDVRGNRGGRYGILRALYGYFIADDTPPYVTNVAAYRLSPRFKPDHLFYRDTYPMEYTGWNAEQRRSIIKLAASFRPEWPLPEGRFSEWHYMLLGRSGRPDQYYYDNPVAVLSDSASFSASDGFLSAFADIPGVVLIGEPSSGGSGGTRYFTLPNSKIRILLSTMASFRPNGKLFDGNGVEVDIEVKPAIADFMTSSDAVLERAIAWIGQANLQRRTTDLVN